MNNYYVDEDFEFGDLIEELETWKRELGTDYEDVIIYNAIETFEDMLFNR